MTEQEEKELKKEALIFTQSERRSHRAGAETWRAYIMNRVAEIPEDIFFLSNTACLARLKYFIYSLSVKFICLAFIVYMFFTYKMDINGFMSIFFVVSFFFVVSLLLYADFNLTAKRLRDVGVPFPYWVSSVIFILFATYLAGFDNQIVRWLVITVSMISYILPTGMLKKKESTDENF